MTHYDSMKSYIDSLTIIRQPDFLSAATLFLTLSIYEPNTIHGVSTRILLKKNQKIRKSYDLYTEMKTDNGKSPIIYNHKDLCSYRLRHLPILNYNSELYVKEDCEAFAVVLTGRVGRHAMNSSFMLNKYLLLNRTSLGIILNETKEAQENCQRIKWELIEKTWHPSRWRNWCLDFQEILLLSNFSTWT